MANRTRTAQVDDWQAVNDWQDVNDWQPASAPNAGLAGPSSPNISMDTTAADPIGIARGAYGAARKFAAAIPQMVPHNISSNNPQELAPSLGREGEGLIGGLTAFKDLVMDPVKRAQQGDKAGAIGEGAVNLASIIALAKSGKGVTKKALPSAARAGQNYTEVMAQASQQPVSTAVSGMAAERVRELASRGGQLPKVVRDFLRRTSDEELGPLTYREAEDFISHASRKTATDIHGQSLTPKMRTEVGKFAAALRADIKEAAAQVGMGDVYGQAVREYRAARQLKRATQAAGTAAGVVSLEEVIRRKLFRH